VSGGGGGGGGQPGGSPEDIVCIRTAFSPDAPHNGPIGFDVTVEGFLCRAVVVFSSLARRLAGGRARAL